MKGASRKRLWAGKAWEESAGLKETRKLFSITDAKEGEEEQEEQWAHFMTVEALCVMGAAARGWHTVYSTLKALGITSRVNLEKIRKGVAKRTFEAHDLMLRSYYAVKFSSSSPVDFSRLKKTRLLFSIIFDSPLRFRKGTMSLASMDLTVNLSPKFTRTL